MRSAASESAIAVSSPSRPLLRILGVGFGIAVIVGNTIGSGILLTPGEIAAHLRSPWSVMGVWALGGVYALVCTLSVTELATTLSQAGGWYVFSQRAFGQYGGFIVGFCDWIMQSSAIAYLAVAAGEFAADLEPAIRGRERLTSVAFVIILMSLNLLGLREGSWTQKITSLMKALALMAFVIACFVFSGRIVPGGLAVPRALTQLPPEGLLFAVIVALEAVVVSYDGWYGAIYFVEEDADPAKNLPRSSIVGVVACGAIFLLVNAAYLHILSTKGLAASKMPAAEAAEAMFGGLGRSAILVVSLITAISTINASLMIAPRILFGMARDGLMPRWLTPVNAGGTPGVGLLLSAGVSILLVLSGSFETIVAMASILFVAVYLSGFVSLFILRSRYRETLRPFKMWGYPWSNLAICIASAGFLIGAVVADPRHALFTAAVIALSYPVYAIYLK